MRRIRVLFVIGTLDVGGTEGQLVELLRRIDRKRFEPILCCLSSTGPLADAVTAAGVPIHVCGFRGFRGLRNLPALVRLVRLIRRTRPDVIHALLFWAYVIGAVAARLAGAPAVIASRRSLGRFKEGKPHYLLLERVANRCTDLIVANSAAVRADAIRLEGLEPERVLVVPNGVDPTRYTQAPDAALAHALGLAPRGAAVGCIANLIHYKGHVFLLEAWARVARELPGARLLVAGEGPERAALERTAGTLGVSSRVRFLGLRDDVAALLALVDVVVLPSLEEGLPNALLEAMAAARPVVASRVGGVPELVIDGETGLLVPPADAEALADALLALLRDPERARRMGEAGRRRAQASFAISRMVGAKEEIYTRAARSMKATCQSSSISRFQSG